MSHSPDNEDHFMGMDYSGDTVKRPRNEENDGISSKRCKADSILLKQLFPSLITGLIIGKGGEAITKLQADTNTTIKMSKNGDFFPGTADRICVILGSVDCVKDAHNAVWDKIKKRQEIPAEDLKVRLVVPNVTVGMIIGKAGCYVKQIKDDTGATVQVSAKSPNPLLLERIVTVSGTPEQVAKAFDMVYMKICEDPQSGSCPNTSYTEVGGSLAISPTELGLGGSFMGLGNMGMSGVTMPTGNPFSSFNFAEATRKMNPINVENLRATLRASGCSAQGVEEITGSLLVLASYNLLANLQATQPGTVSLEYLANVLNGVPSSTSTNAYGDGKSENPLLSFYSTLSTASSATNGSSAVFGTGNTGGSASFDLITELSDGSKEMQVNESLIGAVLGPAGRNIIEIQKFTNTSIQISKKGVFAPGTKNRLVTIRGTNGGDIDKAVFMIQQYVLQEESKRNRDLMHPLSKY
ncbi:hypothetical protein HELRODRAFT_112347 [Helobdella robusta]|uniref:K Homology domain-containing protein n=1 Tax=Helobdella robusta TaxID=6412 RepID=T1EFJ0_HELRO|nr:hypothetical protein HELRODRAFT_112347 [Helobdella robusta]ESO03483.1 hypothetical protein HELRODRAFT_112347 [Helobdella robusta]